MVDIGVETTNRPLYLGRMVSTFLKPHPSGSKKGVAHDPSHGQLLECIIFNSLW